MLVCNPLCKPTQATGFILLPLMTVLDDLIIKNITTSRVFVFFSLVASTFSSVSSCLYLPQHVTFLYVRRLVSFPHWLLFIFFFIMYLSRSSP